ncbi:ROK family transcriptional regulator [Saccharopolyspora griseoalba]|uniref:ROK family protein n=1 Tax=Saccharopolyspora griseoalba TaxID=1431848 RepID=A0ABW2LLQ2_9PSEU
MTKASWQGTNLPRVGGFNRAVVLDTIRRHGEISRVELAQRTGLTAQTMSNIVRALMDDGLVTENGHAPSTGGKRRVLLKVVPDACAAVGLHLDPERITGVLLDLAGGVLLRTTRRLPADPAPAAVAAALTRTGQHLVRRSGLPAERVLGTGLAVPGPMDSAHRTVLDPPNLPGWTEVPLADLVEERFEVPVVMDNDATAAAIGERWSGCERRTGSFVYAYLGTGVGIGVVLDDQVHRGVSNNAGEIGHVHSGGGRPCHCGRRGCLEAYCSMRSIVADWREANGQPEPTSVAAAYDQLCREAVAGNSAARNVLRRTATRLGQSLASVVSVLDVDRVVLGGPALRHVAELVRSRVAKVVNTQVWAPHVRPVQVESALIGTDAAAVGAASLVFDHTYSPRLNTLLGS